MSDFKSSFSKKTGETLTKKSADSLKSMLKGKSFMQASMDSMNLLSDIVEAEKPHRGHLEQLAKEVIYDMYPIVKQSGIIIDAKLVDQGGLNLDQSDSEDEISDEGLEKSGIDKRRLINAITQGAAIRGTKSYYIFKDIIDLLDDSLLNNYNDILANSYGIYDDDNAIALMLSMMSQNSSSQGGESEVDWDDEEGTLTIKAEAVCFPILVHEIVKGLYEILSLQGFSQDAEKNKQIVQKVDKVSNEPEDLRYGKFLYDAINKHVVDSEYYTENSRELFFIEVYKLSDTDFKNFIENSLNDELTSYEKIWVKNTLKNIKTNS